MSIACLKQLPCSFYSHNKRLVSKITHSKKKRNGSALVLRIGAKTAFCLSLAWGLCFILLLSPAGCQVQLYLLLPPVLDRKQKPTFRNAANQSCSLRLLAVFAPSYRGRDTVCVGTRSQNTAGKAASRDRFAEPLNRPCDCDSRSLGVLIVAILEREREKAEDVVYVFELFEHFNKSPGSRCTIAFSVSVML